MDLDSQTPLERRAQEAIIRLTDVQHARVVAGPDSRIQEIHVVSKSTRSPKQIVRDIESCLAARLGIHVDHKVISVAKEDAEDAAEGAPRPRFPSPRLTEIEAGPRPRRAPREAREPEAAKEPDRIGFRRANKNVSDQRTEVEVELHRDGVVGIGRASGPSTRRNAVRLVAQAAIEAVDPFLGGERSLALEEVSLVEMAGRRVAVVVVAAMGPRGEKALTGSCLAEDDPDQALVFAVLDAVNRLASRSGSSGRRVEYEVGPASAA